MPLDTMLFVGRIDVFRQEGIDAVLDKAQGAGIGALLLGDLVIEGSPAFEPDPGYYSGLSAKPPQVTAEVRPKAEAFRRAVERAKARGLRLYLHDWGQSIPGMGGRGCLNDPAALEFGLARTRDARRAFPEIDGFVLDGPEFGYEIEPGHRSDLFGCLCETCAEVAEKDGFDIDLMRRGRDFLKEALKRIDVASARRFLECELALTDVLDFLVAHPDLYEWFRFKAHSIVKLLSAYRDCIKEMDEALAIACGPRLPAFAPLTGYNYRLIAPILDFFCPKLYLWQHGIDGLKGTIGRYAATLMAWNPALTESAAIRLVSKAFGTPLPGMETLASLDEPLAPEFFAWTLSGEIEKAIARCGDAQKLRFFMGLHHGGVHMTSDEMREILSAIEASPSGKVLYWEYGDITEEQWKVLRAFAQ